MQSKPGIKYFIHSLVWRHSRRIQNFITLQGLIKTPQKFISLWETVKTTIKLCKRFFFHKINKKMQSKPGIKYFIHSLVWRHSRRIQNFITLQGLIKTPQKFIQGSFSIKRKYATKPGMTFWPQVSFKRHFGFQVNNSTGHTLL